MGQDANERLPSANTALSQINAEACARSVQVSCAHRSESSSFYHYSYFKIIKLRTLETFALTSSNVMKELNSKGSENKVS